MELSWRQKRAGKVQLKPDDILDRAVECLKPEKAENTHSVYFRHQRGAAQKISA